MLTLPPRLRCAPATTVESPSTWLAWTSRASDAACSVAPYSLVSDAAGDPGAPPLFVDYPSTTFPGPARDCANSGRVLFEALTLAKAVTHLALPLTSKSRSTTWWANVTVGGPSRAAVGP